jgi:hypothetical protein
MNYYSEITNTLQGRTPALRDIQQDRLDWSGMSALLELIDKTSGQDRKDLISAMEQIIEAGEEPPHVIAQVIQVATSLDLAEVEPSIRKLQSKEIAAEESIQKAINDYIAYRNSNTQERAELVKGIIEDEIAGSPEDAAFYISMSEIERKERAELEQRMAAELVREITKDETARQPEDVTLDTKLSEIEREVIKRNLEEKLLEYIKRQGGITGDEFTNKKENMSDRKTQS